MSELGTVLFYDAIKGFGFLKLDRAGPDVFISKSELLVSGIAKFGRWHAIGVPIATGPPRPPAVGQQHSPCEGDGVTKSSDPLDALRRVNEQQLPWREVPTPALPTT
jgi:cold shock CspA family protein